MNKASFVVTEKAFANNVAMVKILNTLDTGGKVNHMDSCEEIITNKTMESYSTEKWLSC